MNILYIGDVMAEPGMRAIKRFLPDIKQQYNVDFVIAQAENSNPVGKGPSHKEIDKLKAYGVDCFTGGNHSLSGDGSEELFKDPSVPIVRPANLNTDIGVGYRVIDSPLGLVLVVSMLGQTVGRQLDMRNPLVEIDMIYEATKDQPLVARIVNLHGDFSSEKRVFGYYLDGRFSLVVGDHWHVPTADAMILPNGTAHITDVGMCGTIHSSLGVKTEVIAKRWLTGQSSRNEIEFDGPLQFNAVLTDVDLNTGLAKSILQVQRIES